MKYGAVCSPVGDWGTKVNILGLMGPQTVRVSMFYANASTRQFADWQLDQLLNTGLSELIIQSGETADAATAQAQLNQFIGYVDTHPNTLFVYELGNEPDVHEVSATVARQKRLTTLRDVKPQYATRSNLLWAINMPSQNATPDYFNAFVLDPGDGLGNLLTGPNQPQLVTVHCYGFSTLCRSDNESPYKMIDWVRGYTAMNIKVTEAGIYDGVTRQPDDLRGARYVEFAEKVTWPWTSTRGGGGNLDSVCFYGLPDVGAAWNITDALARAIGSRASANDCS